YNTRPDIDEAVLDTAGPVTPGDVVEFDVTPAITGDGTYGFALVSTVANAVVYQSREAGSGGPQLIVTFGSD
ncbi:MAG: alkaline phosphatase, partial [bacterium]|nr:alkaline phosphatase [bacterium]